MSDYFHAIAVRPGGRVKSFYNKTEEEIFETYVVPFVRDGTIRAKWGATITTMQVVELRVYATKSAYNKASGGKLEDFLRGKRNRFEALQKRARSLLEGGSHRVFIVMPIQGDEYGGQDQKRIWREFDRRFLAMEKLLASYNCVAIRIDKEVPLESLVSRIKREISEASFVIADLTDERPSCYFECGYSEATGKAVVYIASKESVINPRVETRIHFDIHQNVAFFGSVEELVDKLSKILDKHLEDIVKQ